MLAAGTFAQAGYTSFFAGVIVLAPALQAHDHLSLTQIGVVLGAPSIGAIFTLYPWGLASDRFGERSVIGTGLVACAACLAGAAFVSSFSGLTLFLLLAGGFGAGVNTASGRAVLHWFGPLQRGLALGVRQTAVPIAGAVTALAVPPLVSHNDPRPAILALAGASLAAAVVGLLVIREGPIRADEGRTEPSVSPVRDRRVWLLAAGGALMVEPQVCLVGFFVLFLHGQRNMTTAGAASALAVLNVLGICARIGVGRWSDHLRSRIVPLRRIALASAALVLCCTALTGGPLVALVPLLVLMGCVTISWNGLAFAATAEIAGHARSGTALGVQQTALAFAAALLPIAFGALVAGTSWRLAFGLSALFPLLGRRLLRTIAV